MSSGAPAPASQTRPDSVVLAGVGLLVTAALATGLTGCAETLRVSLPPHAWEPVPEVVEADPLAAYVAARLTDMTLREKVASLLILHVPGTDPGPIRAVLDGTGAAGVIYMGDNVPDTVAELAASTATLSRDPGLPVLVAIDQEGGQVERLPGDDFPAASQLRSLGPAAAREAFAARAALVASAGVDINFGIVADVTDDRGSFIFPRVLGVDAAAAAARVAEAVRGETGLVLSTLKHFPGHGATPDDSHSSIPTTGMGYDEWRATQAPPFEAGIAAGAPLVMLGHLRYSEIDAAPASLSAEWIRILRDDLGFDGIIVSDDMTMLERSGEEAYEDQAANAVAAIAAGTTLLVYVGAVDVAAIVEAVVDAVGNGVIPVATIDDAAGRVLELRRTESGRTGPYVSCDADCREFID